MKTERIAKGSFVVIGKEGSTLEGDGFIRRLWDAANSNFDQVSHLAKRDESGNLVGVWGAMSDFARTFMPWDDFSNGLYLAGVECIDGAEAPEGWTRWVVPACEYLRIENDGRASFAEMLECLNGNGFSLAGAVHDFSDPQTGKQYCMFPIRRL